MIESRQDILDGLHLARDVLGQWDEPTEGEVHATEVLGELIEFFAASPRGGKHVDLVFKRVIRSDGRNPIG